MKTIFLISLVIFSADFGHAEGLNDSDWLQYFVPPTQEEVTYQATVTDPFGRSVIMTQKQRNKGKLDIDGRSYTKYVVLHDRGPNANKPIELLERVSDEGLYESKDGRTETLLVPRPLSIGQSWKSGSAFFTFAGFEDYDTFKGIIKNCVKVTSVNGDKTGVKYYEKGKGLVFKTEGQGSMQAMKVLSEYAAGTE